jgi:hypothetical protein
MSDVVLAESIYVKRSTGKFGVGGTSRKSIIETFWFPIIARDGCVELYPVSDDLQRVLKIVEKIPFELFKKEYSEKEDSGEVYLQLKARIS